MATLSASVVSNCHVSNVKFKYLKSNHFQVKNGKTMRNLQDLPPLNLGEVSLCVIDDRMQCSPFQHATLSIFTKLLDNYPQIIISNESLQCSTRGEAQSFFLPVEVSFLKHLTQVYYEQGLTETLNVMSHHNSAVVSKSALLALTVMKYFKKMQIILNPSLSYSIPNLINELSQTRNYVQFPVRCIVWHPDVSKFAVAIGDDGVRIYWTGSNLHQLLKCKHQKNVTSLAWRPLSQFELAVGCERGIIIWKIDPNPIVSRPSVISNATVLYRLGHSPVTSILWDSQGSILLSAAANQGDILAWDVELDQTTILKRSGDAGNVLLKLSPRADKLVSCSTGIAFRIWNCCTWKCERWTVLSGRVQSACWTNNNLLFATNKEPIIYGLLIKNELIFTSDSDITSKRATPLFDLTKLELNGLIVGGLVQCMESDPKGNHLAVLFKESDCIVVFNVVKQQGLQLIASSLIVGFHNEIPSVIAFQQNFKYGACLTIGWSSGRIQYYPIIYSDLEKI